MSESELRLPSEKVLKHVAKLSIEQDKPIMMDYWEDSYGDASVLIGVRSGIIHRLLRRPLPLPRLLIVLARIMLFCLLLLCLSFFLLLLLAHIIVLVCLLLLLLFSYVLIRCYQSAY